MTSVMTVTTQLLAEGFKVPGATKWADMEDTFIEDEQNPWEAIGEPFDWDIDYNKLEAFEDLEQEDEPQGPPPGVMSVELQHGHVVEMLQPKPPSTIWGLDIETRNGRLYINTIKEHGHWYAMLGSKYIGWCVQSVQMKEDPGEVKALLRAHITHRLRFHLAPCEPTAQVGLQEPPPKSPIEVHGNIIEIDDASVLTEVDDIGDERCLDCDLDDMDWFNYRFTFCKCCYKWHRRFAIDNHVYHQSEDMDDYQELLESASMDVRDIFHGFAKDGIDLPDYAVAEVNSIEHNASTQRRLRLAKTEDQLWWKATALAAMMPATRFYGYNLTSK